MRRCSRNKKSIPVNKKLYSSIKKKVKSRSKVWPSAYASGQLVKTYKSRGGKYKCSFGSLDRWFKEKWVNVCKPTRKGYKACGRSKSKRKGYPYCRPSKRVNSKTPKTIKEISRKKLKEMCRRKRKKPYSRVFLHSFGKKNKMKRYTMQKEQTCGFGSKSMENSCGFGRRRTLFGNNLEKSKSNDYTFYQKGAIDSSHLTKGIRKCESTMYGQNILQSNYRFGNCGCNKNPRNTLFSKKKDFIKKAFKTFERKGTKGAFTRWCKSKGYPKVTNACIKAGKKSKSPLTRKRATFAKNIRSKKRKYSFGKVGNGTLKKVNKDITYLLKL